jgi:outer membrane protein assembly factor BamB
MTTPACQKKVTTSDNTNVSWPQWRGPLRSGIVDWLPDKLLPEPQVVWDVPLGRPGLGGIAATQDFVFFSDRDVDDFHDVYRCLDARTGQQVWEVLQLAIGRLDYGNSPRATPLIVGDQVVFCGAFGDVTCVNIVDGSPVWHTNLRTQFKADTELPWGYCASPLLVDGKLILNPGASDASLVALDPSDGSLIWQSAGLPAAYGSFIAERFGGVEQIVGHDAKTLGGWDSKTGQRLWTIAPPHSGEFNVPTPLNLRGQLLICTEQNGTRLYSFGRTGLPQAEPRASNRQLTPDMSSPILIGSYVFCVNKFLYCLDADNDLQEVWRIRDKSISDYGSLIASQDRLLVVGDGELLLMRTTGHKEIVSRQRIFDSERIYSHPALVGRKLYIRGETRIKCIEL